MKISERPGPGFSFGEAKDRAPGPTQQEELMRKFHRAMTAGVLSVPMVLAIGGVASAEGTSFDQHQATVGPDGVATQRVDSRVTDNGDASFQKSNSSVGPDGASSGNTSSNSGHHGGLLGGVLGL